LAASTIRRPPATGQMPGAVPRPPRPCPRADAFVEAARFGANLSHPSCAFCVRWTPIRRDCGPRGVGARIAHVRNATCAASRSLVAAVARDPCRSARTSAWRRSRQRLCRSGNPVRMRCMRVRAAVGVIHADRLRRAVARGQRDRYQATAAACPGACGPARPGAAAGRAAMPRLRAELPDPAAADLQAKSPEPAGGDPRD
jgi:hypothetical protein